MKYALSCVLMVSLLVAGCGKKTPAEPTKKAASTKVSSGAVLARVNNWTLQIDEFNLLVRELEKTAPPNTFDVGQFEVKKRIVEQLVRNEALFQIGMASGLGNDPNLAKLPADAQKQLVAQTMMRNIRKQVSVTEEEIKNYYELNKDSFRQPLSEISKEIEIVLERMKVEAAIVQLINGLHDKIQVAINYDLLKSRS